MAAFYAALFSAAAAAANAAVVAPIPQVVVGVQGQAALSSHVPMPPHPGFCVVDDQGATIKLCSSSGNNQDCCR
eukprot:1161384-Pelagomonas_calceolata.AAC.3